MNNLIQELTSIIEIAKGQDMPLEIISQNSKFDIAYEYVSTYEICLLKQMTILLSRNKDIDDKALKDAVKKRPIRFRAIKKLMKYIPDFTRTLRLSQLDFTVWSYSHSKRILTKTRGAKNENGYTKS